MAFDFVVYKLTFPNGKIYIGVDVAAAGHSLRYFGSWFNQSVIDDFTDKELRDFTLRKEIIFESKDKVEIYKKEGEFIRELKSNDPAIGYNRTHRSKKSGT